MARLSFRCDDALVAAVDEARGSVPREKWLRTITEDRIKNPTPADQDIRVESVRPHPRRLTDVSGETVATGGKVFKGMDPKGGKAKK